MLDGEGEPTIILTSSRRASLVFLFAFPPRLLFSSWAAAMYSIWNCLYSESMLLCASQVLRYWTMGMLGALRSNDNIIFVKTLRRSSTRPSQMWKGGLKNASVEPQAGTVELVYLFKTTLIRAANFSSSKHFCCRKFANASCGACFGLWPQPVLWRTSEGYTVCLDIAFWLENSLQQRDMATADVMSSATSWEALKKQADAAFNKGQYDLAVASYGEAIDTAFKSNTEESACAKLFANRALSHQRAGVYTHKLYC